MSQNIYQKGCLIILTTRFWGATKKLDPSQMGELPTEIVRATRDLLLDNSKVAAVRGILGEARRFVKSNTIYFPVPSVDFINKNRISYVNEALESRKEWAMEALDDLIRVFEHEKQKYANKYPELYSEGNYPTPAQLRDNFVFDWQFVMIQPPGKDYGVLSPEMYEAEVAKFQKSMKEFEDSLVSIVAKEFYDRIDKLRDQCIGTGDISASTVKSVTNVLDRFATVYDGCIQHEELQSMIEDIRMYMDGTEYAMLKADGDFRRIVGEKMKEVTSLIVNSKDARLTRRLDI